MKTPPPETNPNTARVLALARALSDYHHDGKPYNHLIRELELAVWAERGWLATA